MLANEDRLVHSEEPALTHTTVDGDEQAQTARRLTILYVWPEHG